MTTTVTDKPKVTVYTDGGATPNPGPGGWGVLLIFEKNGEKITKELNGGAEETTNNRMELTAALEALRTLKQSCQIEFYTDSQYLKKGINEWMANWKATNFKNGKIQNSDLWEKLDTEVARHDINWHWVKGHAGNHYNEIVDKLATAGRPAVAGIPTTHTELESAGTRAYLSVSCLGAPGVGAWAVLLDQNGDQSILTGGHPKTNAARMDLLAAIAALEAIPPGTVAQIFTGNSYLRDGITQWVSGWKKNGWMKKTGGEVQYRNLWQHLDKLAQDRKIQWVLVKSDKRPEQMATLDMPLKEAIAEARHLEKGPDEPIFKL
jgi:ribonuclease HI